MALKTQCWLQPSKNRQQAVGVADPAENATLGHDHLQTSLVKCRKIRRTPICQGHTAVAPVIAFANGGMDAYFSGYTAHQQCVYAPLCEYQFQIGLVKRAFAWLVDDHFASHGGQLGNDVVAWFAANQDAPHRPRCPD